MSETQNQNFTAKWKDFSDIDVLKITEELLAKLNSREQDILTKETPYVLLLEKNYGMGKTFFSTRFTQYLRNKNLEAIYGKLC